MKYIRTLIKSKSLCLTCVLACRLNFTYSFQIIDYIDSNIFQGIHAIVTYLKYTYKKKSITSQIFNRIHNSIKYWIILVPDVRCCAYKRAWDGFYTKCFHSKTEISSMLLNLFFSKKKKWKKKSSNCLWSGAHFFPFYLFITIIFSYNFSTNTLKYIVNGSCRNCLQ